MFKQGDYVLYGAQGVFKISDVSKKQIGKTSADYYTLTSVFGQSTTVLVPTQNELLVSRLHNVIDKSDAAALIKDLPCLCAEWINNDTERLKTYREALSSGDRRATASVLRALYLERRKRKETGKKMHNADEALFTHAKNVLFDELAFAMGKSREEIEPYIKSSMGEE